MVEVISINVADDSQLAFKGNPNLKNKPQEAGISHFSVTH